jgi:hypothetical protein
MNLMRVASVIESWKAFQAKSHPSCYRADAPNDLMIVWRHIDQAASLDGHEIDKLSNPVGGKKTGDQHVGIRQVKLFTALRGHRTDFEISSLFIIQDGREDAWRIEVRQTAPIDAAVHTYQRHGVKVADNTVILNGLIRHFYSFLPSKQKIAIDWWGDWELFFES